MQVYDELERAAGLDPDRAVIRIITSYEPAGGPNARVYPPTYPMNRADDSPYVIEPRRFDGEQRTAVLLDSVPSEANRAEEALLCAARDQALRLPMISIEHAEDVIITSLEAPHRYADAYLRDSTIDGIPFDKSEVGKAMLASTMTDASGLYRHDPGSLVYGAWNSHRKGRQTRFPRVYASEIVGWDPAVGVRRAGRMDPFNLQGAAVGSSDEWEYQAVQEKAGSRKDKGVRLSEIGHGNIAPGEAHGGVTIAGAARTATLSFAALDRLRFGSAPRDAQVAARTALAALALAGDRLAFGGGSLWLRSGCELLVTEEAVSWVGRGGKHEAFQLSADDAVALFETARDRAQQAGLRMDLEPIVMKPNKALAAAIDYSLTRATVEE